MMLAWLGDIKGFKLQKGYFYETVDKTTGEIRSVVPAQRLRLTRKPEAWEKTSTLQVLIIPTGDKTAIRFHQENLSSAEKREEMREFWQRALGELAKLLS